MTPAEELKAQRFARGKQLIDECRAKLAEALRDDEPEETTDA